MADADEAGAILMIHDYAEHFLHANEIQTEHYSACTGSRMFLGGWLSVR